MAVNGLVVPTPDGDYQVILNSRQSPQAQRKAYCHELRHILHNHFSAYSVPITALEDAAKLEGYLQTQIELAEEQGLAGPSPYKPPALSAKKAPTAVPSAPQNINMRSLPFKNISPGVLRAMRAQHTGLWY